MKLSAPKQATFLISLLLLVLAIIVRFAAIQPLLPYVFWIAVTSQVVLMIGCAIKGF